jgi:hypothetical protein
MLTITHMIVYGRWDKSLKPFQKETKFTNPIVANPGDTVNLNYKLHCEPSLDLDRYAGSKSTFVTFEEEL